jgi:hypothetical protein
MSGRRSTVALDIPLSFPVVLRDPLNQIRGGTPRMSLTVEKIIPEKRYSVAVACDWLDLSRDAVFKRIRNGVIKSFKDGGRRYINGSELLRLSRAPE